jgi:hypothetical protein
MRNRQALDCENGLSYFVISLAKGKKIRQTEASELKFVSPQH